MNLQELKNEANKLSVIDRLALVDAIIQSLGNELRLRSPVPEDIVERMTGLAKNDVPPPTDAEVEAMLEERLAAEYLK